MKAHIVKRRPRDSEPYEENKVFTSVYAACLGVHAPEGEAKITAQRICRDIAPWLESKPEVTSADIRRKAAEILAMYNPHAAYLYKNHRITA